jgi:hypothetical protein
MTNWNAYRSGLDYMSRFASREPWMDQLVVKGIHDEPKPLYRDYKGRGYFLLIHHNLWDLIPVREDLDIETFIAQARVLYRIGAVKRYNWVEGKGPVLTGRPRLAAPWTELELELLQKAKGSIPSQMIQLLAPVDVGPADQTLKARRQRWLCADLTYREASKLVAELTAARELLRRLHLCAWLDAQVPPRHIEGWRAVVWWADGTAQPTGGRYAAAAQELAMVCARQPGPVKVHLPDGALIELPTGMDEIGILQRLRGGE